MKSTPMERSAPRRKPLLLVQLNELNFDVVNRYLDSGVELPFLRRLMATNCLATSSETEYSHLEPWIQWPSVYTGLPFSEHKIFRLGDAVTLKRKQIFEIIEARGFRVGVLGAMNAANNLVSPAYFIPDPWTNTLPSKDKCSNAITRMLKQTVNDNSSGRISVDSFFTLLWSFFVYVRFRRKLKLIKYALTSFGKPWRKALWLDYFLHEIHLRMLKSRDVDFSTVFYNAGAHIQHHYFLCSSVEEQAERSNPEWYIRSSYDPVLEMLQVYDEIVGDYLTSRVNFVVATGLSQRPVLNPVFYYRLLDHDKFLQLIGVKHRRVLPRMTRDFLIEFDNDHLAKEAAALLGKLMVDQRSVLFGEIDQRGSQLFVVLTFPDVITKATKVWLDDASFSLKQHVVFVALKNGLHDPKGYAFLSDGIDHKGFDSGGHVKGIFNVIDRYFAA